MMEPHLALARAPQLESQLSSCVLSVVKWIAQAPKGNRNLEAFKNELQALQITYEKLKSSVHEPGFTQAACDTDMDVGGFWWFQISVILGDCHATLEALSHVLDLGLSNTTSSVLKGLNKSLECGTLAHLRQRVQLFNTNLALPLRMVKITHLLQEKGENYVGDEKVLVELNEVDGMVNLLRNRVTQRLGPRTGDIPEVRVDLPGESDMYANIEAITVTTDRFLRTASAAASGRATLSTVSGMPLTAAYATNVEQWMLDVGIPPDSQQSDAQSSSISEDEPDGEKVRIIYSSQEYDQEHDQELIRKYVDNGLEDLGSQDYSSAKDNFGEALKSIQENGFGEDLAFNADDLTLKIAECCLRLCQYDEVVELLSPIEAVTVKPREEKSMSTPVRQPAQPQRPPPETSVGLMANQLLAEAYLKQENYEHAERCAKHVFVQRKHHLNESDPKYIGSVQLLIEIAIAMKNKPKERVYRGYLPAAIKDDVSVPHPPPESVPEAQVLHIPKRVDSKHSEYSTQKDTRWRQLSKWNRSKKSHQSSAEQQQLLEPRGGQLIQLPPRPAASVSTSGGLSSSLPIRLLNERDLVRRVKLLPRFQAVGALCAEGNLGKAVSTALELLGEYDPDLLRKRESEIKNNIQKGKKKGLAATGCGYAALHFFCEVNVESTMEVGILLELGADMNATIFETSKSRTECISPLQLAIKTGQAKLVRLLLDKGVGISTPQKKKAKVGREMQTLHPLLEACLRGYVDVVTSLLEHGVTLESHDFSPRFWHGNSLLHEACWRSNLRMVRALLASSHDHSANTETRSTVGSLGHQDAMGMTPLMYAMDCKEYMNLPKRHKKIELRLELAELLLGRTVNDRRQEALSDVFDLQSQLHIKDNEGKTVFWYADQEGPDPDLMSLLRHYCTATCGADEDHDLDRKMQAQAQHERERRLFKQRQLLFVVDGC